MLSLSKVRLGGERYYLEACVGRGWSGLVEPEGIWVGGALERPSDAVDAERLAALFAGVDPRTGEILDSRHDRTKVAAFDCTFAAPKSVSVLHALGTRDVAATVRAAHDASVDASLDYLERHAARLRRGSETVVRTEGGLCGAAFVHRTSRAPDPHLHSHVLVANLGCDEAGRWSALDARALYLHAGTAGALYRAQLRRELVERLGVCWALRGDGFGDLVGLPRAVVLAFSQRQAQIAAELRRAGGSGRRARRIAADSTRPAKDLDRPYEELVAEWRERALAVGLSAGQLSRIAPGIDRDIDAVPLAERATRALVAFERPCTRHELLRATCRQLIDGARIVDVEREVDVVLDSRHLASPGGAPRRTLGGSGRRFPGEPEPRFVSPTLQLRLGALERRLAAAPDLAGIDAATTRTLRLVVAGRGDDGVIRVAEQLSELAARARIEGRSVLGIASSRRRAAHLEALTGIAATTFVPEHATSADALLVVDAAPGFALSGMERLVDAAGERRTVVVVQSGPALRSAEPGRETAANVGKIAALEEVGEHRVLFTVRASESIAVTRQIQRRLVGEGRQAVLVTADRDLAGALGEGAVASNALPGVLEREPASELVVLGGVAVLGASVPDAFATRRTHVLVMAGDPSPSERRRQALEAVGSRSRARWKPRLERRLLGAERLVDAPGIATDRAMRGSEGGRDLL